jgi:hypothetical protein
MTSATKSLIGADGAFVLPLGNFSDGAGIGLGALMRYEYNVAPQLNVTGRVGFLYHLGKDVGGGTVNFWNIPVLVGAKYDIASGLYGAAEAGLFYNHASATVTIPGFGSQTVSNSETDFGFNVGAGYKMGDLDIRAGLQIWNISHAGDTMGVIANVGYNFAKM